MNRTLTIFNRAVCSRVARTPSHLLDSLDEDDKEFVLAFVLASGSLKALASSYGVSYPTIRARLDRLIARLEDRRAGRTPDPVREMLADLVQRGELSARNARKLLDAVKDAVKDADPDR